MILRILLGIVFLSTLTGCATTGAKNQQEQLQTRITELERKVEERDSEVVDLQYQVKDLSSKINPKDSQDIPISQQADEALTFSKSSSKGSDEIIRVNASVTDIQTALRNAGVYTGKIDGKVGTGTKAAIMAFQQQHHLTADGILGKRTWKLLKSFLKE